MIQIKNAKELDGMRRANALSAAALKYGGQHIEAGMTTWELEARRYPQLQGTVRFPGNGLHQPE